ncbi:transmembrane and coiled-coil domain-containing protein 4 [Patagioenas fasciata monilis]|uniref:Transmembrane and coiled-coil domain-containing protein 4 n=1 Tax=Patagioenas fasciata monilis TaxID=372326 RepID=A0A1V4KP96_PATFA|nr:transmembrane and coiled-coil domain-containing protein 4 [Patagioenas fasciata monilis]
MSAWYGEGREGKGRAAAAEGARLLCARPDRQQVKMAVEEKWKTSAEQEGEKEPCVLLGQQLGEPGKFAYAALCGISLAQLFPEKEQSSFRMEFIEGFVKWLDLPEAVLPAMTAFAGGLGGEGTETFAQILLKDPILKENPVVITQDLLSFSLRDGYYDARARVLICHITWLLRVPLEELEVLEESLLESLKEQKEEESE